MMPSPNLAAGVPARENPFATWRTDALSYRFDVGNWDLHFRRLAELQFRGAIVGPQGSGKTTLLHQLVQEFDRRDIRMELVRASTNRDANRRLLDVLERSAHTSDVLLVDSAEPFGWLSWRRLIRLSRSRGLVVAVHRPCRLPTWLTCRPTWATTESLLADLGFSDAESPLMASARDAFARYRGNVRLVFRHLYDECARGALSATG